MRQTPRVAFLVLAVAATGWSTMGWSTSARAWIGPVCSDELETRVERLVPAPPPAPAQDSACPPAPTGDLDADPLLDAGELDLAAARVALQRARTLRADGRHEEALLALDLVKRGAPRVADRVDLLRGDVLLEAERPADAVAPFERARASIDSTVRALARVGRVRALIRSGHRSAASELTALVRYYPKLPQELQLRLELAQALDRAGDENGAARALRDLDLQHPGHPVAAEARAHLEAMAARGVPVRDLTLAQRVERADRLVGQGPMDQARVEVEAILGARLPAAQRARVALMAARIARVEGRWEDARRYLQMGGAAPLPSDPEASAEAAERRADLAAAADARAQDAARRLIAQLKGRSAWGRVSHVRLLQIVKITARAGLVAELDEALLALRRGNDVPPTVSYEAALWAAGMGDDASVAALFASNVAHPRFGTPARYHYARALERMGRDVEAEIQYLRVTADDRSETRWYAMLSEQRLWSVRESMLCRCGPVRDSARQVAGSPGDAAEPVYLAALDQLPDPQRRTRARREGTAPATATRPAVAPADALDAEAVAARLSALAEVHGGAFPQLARAADLLRLGEDEAAADELHEAFLAWRDARGRPLRRTGLEAVYRGEERPRQPVTFAERRDRRRLDPASVSALAEIASVIGDEGTAAGFGGWGHVTARPRAYESMVREAAARHGLDPNLLLAVMRVESVYQRRIVSYAGAVGLMQIMPRTGRLIAEQIGRDDFTTADLLDPETNLDFAAWYLASLIDRFDGRLPLAVASYNGGPHNVRRWLRDHGERVTLDAFVEHIPFDQTHRYVRRVLTHYAAYRAQEGLPMERLSLELPDVGPDPVGF